MKGLSWQFSHEILAPHGWTQPGTLHLLVSAVHYSLLEATSFFHMRASHLSSAGGNEEDARVGVCQQYYYRYVTTV